MYDSQIDYLSKAVVNKKFQKRSRIGIRRKKLLTRKYEAGMKIAEVRRQLQM